MIYRAVIKVDGHNSISDRIRQVGDLCMNKTHQSKTVSITVKSTYVKTANRIKVHDICVPLVHNVMQS